ncbi:MAG TPA: YihY/virulence factor BrkB family protein [Blattabacteriaceae bacterium]|nr:YihY/virulence factor BrkB family protein [Blattabacteriaceae bacterium]
MTSGSVSPAVEVTPIAAPESPASRLLLRPWKHMLLHRGWPTMQYLARTEAHTYAFSVAANAILSFFPFMVLLMWLIRNVFHSATMYNVVVDLLRDHLPAGQDFVIRNLQSLVKARQRVKMASVVILLITSTGVFVPLEVAFNRIWGFAKNRSYLGNQIISLVLAFACGILALISIGMAAGNELALTFMMRGNENIIFRAATFVALKVCATLASIAIFFLIYWLLPNGKIKARSVLPAAVAMGVLWEVGKVLYIKALPWLDFQEVYGQAFSISVALMFWAFISGLMLLAGAHLSSDFTPEAAEAAAENGDENGVEFS